MSVVSRPGGGRPEVVLGEDDTLRLTSVGVDIGSATTQIVFSRIVLEPSGGRYVVTSREVVYESAVLLTPFRDDATIDVEVLRDFFDAQYRSAGFGREEVDTGALLLTGVALLRRNAKAIAELFAEDSGRFVSVAAGDELEALLAAHGSGAVRASRAGGPVLNVDVGGGTTKLSLCVDGRVASVAAIDVGSRLAAWDDDGVLIRVEPAVRTIAARLPVEPALGRRLPPEDRERLARAMAGVIAGAVAGDWDEPAAAELMRTDRIPVAGVRTVRLSGGMSRYVTGAESRGFGDLGPLIARELPRVFAERGITLDVAESTIRATVVGSSQFTVQVSGTTIHVSDPAALPLRNVPVAMVAPPPDGEAGWAGLPERVRAAVALAPGDERALTIAVPWRGSADFASLTAFSRGILEGGREALARAEALVLVVDRDVAGLIGANLVEEFGIERPLVVVDGVELESFDFVDIGEYLDGTASVPITIKSLAF